MTTVAERETEQRTMDTTGPTAVRTMEERGARAAVAGGSIGFVAVAVIVWLLGLATGLDGVTSLGLGVFVGGWGGLGFGGMLAGSIAIAGRDGR